MPLECWAPWMFSRDYPLTEVRVPGTQAFKFAGPCLREPYDNARPIALTLPHPNTAPFKRNAVFVGPFWRGTISGWRTALRPVHA